MYGLHRYGLQMYGKILVVEDSLINQRALSWQLEHLGLSCDIVSTGAASLAALKIRRYEAVLMDMHLPDMEGCQAATLIRQAGFTLPIIALTADDTSKSAQKCFDAGMNEYLCKSLESTALEAALRRWLPAARQSKLEKHTSAESEGLVSGTEFDAFS